MPYWCLVKKMNISSPKQKITNGDKIGKYNYYAGYSNEFVTSVIKEFGITTEHVILDPWNGSGTTTLAATHMGIPSIGIDLNPAMCIVAKSRFATNTDVSIVISKIKNARVSKFREILSNDDYLLHWFEYSTASYIRYLDEFICGKHQSYSSDKIKKLSIPQCLSYLALFKTVRSFLTPFQSSNPTWIKKKNTSGPIKIPNNKIKEKLLEVIKEFNIPEKKSSSSILSEIRYGDAKKIDINEKTIDYIITSPPYCTRLDYGIATSPELAILLGSTSEVDKIRRVLTGRTTIDKNIEATTTSFPDEVCDFLTAVKSHSSRASDTYYYKNLLQYFCDMKKSIIEVSRIIKDTGAFICVVQDSFYKDIYCNLPDMIASLALEYDLILKSKIDFKSMTHMANINTNSKTYRKSTHATESVLIFEKRQAYDN